MMGEARNRGTYEQRKQAVFDAAVERNRIWREGEHERRIAEETRRQQPSAQQERGGRERRPFGGHLTRLAAISAITALGLMGAEAFRAPAIKRDDGPDWT